MKAYCDACGVVRDGSNAIWLAVHFGIRDVGSSDRSLMIHATNEDIRRLGEHHACSRECLQKLIDHWTETWQAKKAALA